MHVHRVLMDVAGAVVGEKRNGWTIARWLLLREGRRRRRGGRSVELGLLARGTKPIERRRRCVVPVTLEDDPRYSRVLNRSYRRRLVSRVSSRLAWRGVAEGGTRGCTRRRRRQLGRVTSWSRGCREWEEHKVCRGMLGEVRLGCWRKPLGWGLGKPCLWIIRDERLVVVWKNGCCRVRTWAA